CGELRELSIAGSLGGREQSIHRIGLVRSQLHGEPAGGRRQSHRNHTEIADANAGEPRFLTLRVFVRKETEGLVFPERTAERQAALRARVGLLDGVQRAGHGIHLSGTSVARLKRFVAEITEGVAMEFVATALGYDIDHTAGGAAILRVVVTEDELKFLHAFLGNRGADAVDGVVAGVRTVDADHVAASARAANAQA